MPFFSRLLATAVPLALAASGVHADVVISFNATQNMTCSAGVCAPTAASAVLNVSDLETLLAAGNVEIVTTGSGVQANNVDVQAAFSWSSDNALSLDAYQSILFEQPVAVAGSAGVSLATNDGGSGGTLSFNPGGNLKFARTINVLSINGQAYVLESSLKSLASAIGANPSGFFALSKSEKMKGKAYTTSPIAATFTGSLNGLGNALENLRIDSLSINLANPSVGLFSQLGSGGSVNSLILSKLTMKIAQSRKATGNDVGAFAGVNNGTLFDDYARGTMSTRVRDTLYVGGLVGYNEGSILGSASAVSIVNVGDKHSVTQVGIGGIAGGSVGPIESSYATGNLTSRSASLASVGGLVGGSDGPIENCFATGSAAIPDSGDNSVGGLAGANETPIVSSYSTGKPSAESGDVGAFVGMDVSNGQLSNNYWDTTTSGVTNLSQGSGNISNDPGITGETTAQLQSGLPTGFDSSIWAEDSNINNGLPYLIANPPRN